MRSFYGSNQFFKFQLHSSTVPGLCVLDQECHQERNDGRAGIYSQLPGIAETKYRAGVMAQTTMISTAAAKVEQAVVIQHSLLYIAIPARADTKVEANPL
jgi:hypothetical protein